MLSESSSLVSSLFRLPGTLFFFSLANLLGFEFATFIFFRFVFFVDQLLKVDVAVFSSNFPGISEVLEP